MRPTEVKMVAAMLESEASDVVELAKAVIRELDASRESRDSWLVRISLGGWLTAMGPFDTEHQAVLVARKMAPGVEDDVLMRSVARLVTPKILGSEEIEPTLGSSCVECQHPMWSHNWPRAKVQGCVIGYQANKPQTGCQCGR